MNTLLCVYVFCKKYESRKGRLCWQEIEQGRHAENTCSMSCLYGIQL